MYKKLFFIIALSIGMFACKKNSSNYSCTPTTPTTIAPDSQLVKLQTYLAGKGLMGIVTRHSNNFYYKIDNTGTGLTPNSCSNIVVTYQGKLTDDSEFAPETSSIFILNQLLEGWQLGLPLIQKGGKIKLYLPPALGYGATAQPGIPANSILIFEITLNDVTNN